VAKLPGCCRDLGKCSRVRRIARAIEFVEAYSNLASRRRILSGNLVGSAPDIRRDRICEGAELPCQRVGKRGIRSSRATREVAGVASARICDEEPLTYAAAATGKRPRSRCRLRAREQIRERPIEFARVDRRVRHVARLVIRRSLSSMTVASRRRNPTTLVPSASRVLVGSTKVATSTPMALPTAVSISRVSNSAVLKFPSIL